MGLKRIDYTDVDGFLRAVLLPETEPEEMADRGIPLGPPSLAELELPKEVEVRLSNELFHRGILTSQDALKRRADILAAIQSALKLTTERIVTVYAGKDYKNGRSQPPEEQSNKTLPNRRPRKPNKPSNIPAAR